ncbi:unnamed protein product [Protopolystoma xenopodis]|uniref:Uncharacterized protein n=1 Tax=Protopolystoma xenopodis TaxID=117903 RepID=A0A3S5CKF3_9PLAT|nr:unnamed protein product [Protopolystoma xenopodis]
MGRDRKMSDSVTVFGRALVEGLTSLVSVEFVAWWGELKDSLISAKYYDRGLRRSSSSVTSEERRRVCIQASLRSLQQLISANASMGGGHSSKGIAGRRRSANEAVMSALGGTSSRRSGL